MVKLENEHLQVVLAEKGAELRSLTGVHSGMEFLWSANPAYWAKVSPVLFPIVGSLKENTYSYKNQSYTLPRHGFARDMEFEVEKRNLQEVVFGLKDSETTRENYPFSFHLQLIYRLVGTSLSCTYKVHNPDPEEVLWFSVGGHPAFAVPLNRQGSYADYYLSFNADSSLRCYHLEGNLISDQTRDIFLEEGKMPLNYSLFYEDALVFKALNSNEIRLMNHKNYNGINFQFTDFPYLALWAAKDADFLCIEPWCGIADRPGHNGQLTEKEGIVCLPPGDPWERTWKVTCF